MSGGRLEIRRDRRERTTSRLVQSGFLVGLAALWHLGANHWGINQLLLPKPQHVIAELGDILSSGEFWPDLVLTLSELAGAFAISLTMGVGLGFLISRSALTIRIFEPLLAGVYAVPIILFLPLYVLFLGLGPASKIALGATISFFPVVLNTIGRCS